MGEPLTFEALAARDPRAVVLVEKMKALQSRLREEGTCLDYGYGDDARIEILIEVDDAYPTLAHDSDGVPITRAEYRVIYAEMKRNGMLDDCNCKGCGGRNDIQAQARAAVLLPTNAASTRDEVRKMLSGETI